MEPDPAPFSNPPRRTDCVCFRRQDKEIRAMDRRRFVPSAEGLEGRALLANSLFGSRISASANVAQEVPVTFQLKEHRIERLPHFLELIKSGRFLPTDTVK